MSTQTESRKASIFSRMTIKNLVEVAEVLEANKSKTPDERMTAAWVSDELENRVGVITESEELEFMRVFDETNSYLAALKSLRPALNV